MTITIYLDVAPGYAYPWLATQPNGSPVPYVPDRCAGAKRYKVEILVDDPAEPDAVAPSKATVVEKPEVKP